MIEACDTTWSLASLTLRDYRVAACVACGFCSKNPMCCSFDKQKNDEGSALLRRLFQAQALIVIAPVYFYGPPAQCKILIDRAQMIWEARTRGVLQTPSQHRPAYYACTAARTQGERLFEASGLILRSFLQHMAFTPQPPLLLRGLDEADAFEQDQHGHISAQDWVEKHVYPTLFI